MEGGLSSGTRATADPKPPPPTLAVAEPQGLPTLCAPGRHASSCCTGIASVDDAAEPEGCAVGCCAATEHCTVLCTSPLGSGRGGGMRMSSACSTPLARLGGHWSSSMQLLTRPTARAVAAAAAAATPTAPGPPGSAAAPPPFAAPTKSAPGTTIG